MEPTTVVHERSKGALRKLVRERLNAETQDHDDCSWQKFLASKLFRDSSAIVGYIAIQKELPLKTILDAALSQGKALFLPRFIDDKYVLARVDNLTECLVAGRYNIPEPADWCPTPSRLPENTLWLVPGLAFDQKGRRLGRGGGFYDRLLADFPFGISIGVCRDCQILPEVPADTFDVPMQALLTPTRWISSKYVLSS